MTSDDLKCPDHFGSVARELWEYGTTEYELERHELALLRVACTSVQQMEGAEQQLEAEGTTVLDRFGQVKPHPAFAQFHQAAQTLRMALRELRLHEADTETFRAPRLAG